MNIAFQTRLLPPLLPTIVRTAETPLAASPLPPPSEQPPDTTQSVRRMSDLGMSPEEIAKQLNGTRHTTGIEDARLAEHVVLTSLAEIDAREKPEECRSNLMRLSTTLRGHLQSGAELTQGHLIGWLGIVDPLRAEQLSRAVRNKELSLEVVKGSVFDKTVRAWGQAPCAISFYSGRGPVPRILIRDLTPASGDLRRLVDRRFERSPLALAHESRHWLDFTGPDAIRLPQFFGARKTRYVTEIRACLDEHRVRARLGDFRMTERAREKKLTLAEAIKEQVYRDYYAWRFPDRIWNRFTGNGTPR